MDMILRKTSGQLLRCLLLIYFTIANTIATRKGDISAVTRYKIIIQNLEIKKRFNKKNFI